SIGLFHPPKRVVLLLLRQQPQRRRLPIVLGRRPLGLLHTFNRLHQPLHVLPPNPHRPRPHPIGRQPPLFQPPRHRHLAHLQQRRDLRHRRQILTRRRAHPPTSSPWPGLWPSNPITGPLITSRTTSNPAPHQPPTPVIPS